MKETANRTKNTTQVSPGINREPRKTDNSFISLPMHWRWPITRTRVMRRRWTSHHPRWPIVRWRVHVWIHSAMCWRRGTSMVEVRRPMRGWTIVPGSTSWWSTRGPVIWSWTRRAIATKLMIIRWSTHYTMKKYYSKLQINVKTNIDVSTNQKLPESST